MFQKFLRKWPIWAGVVAVVAFLADLQGALDFIDKYILPTLRIRVPFGVLAPLLVIVGLGLFFLGRRISLQKTSDDRASIITEGQFLDWLLTFLVSAKERVRIVGLSKDWIFPLAVSVFIARRRNVRVEVICYDGTHERYQLLENLGCAVYRVDEVPVAGVLCDPDEILHCRAALECPRNRRDNIFGRYYFGSLDWYAIDSLNKRADLVLKEQAAVATGDTAYMPELVEVPDQNVIAALRNVRAYEQATFAVEDVAIEKLRPVAQQVIKFKFHQVDHLLRLYEERGWNFFRCCGLKLNNGEISLVVPPIIEIHEDRLCIAEGHTRLFRLKQKGETKAKVIVVRSVTERLPARPGKWSRVFLSDDKTERRDPQFARYIETTTHRNIWASSRAARGLSDH
jgi:hypothetical protein